MRGALLLLVVGALAGVPAAGAERLPESLAASAERLADDLRYIASDELAGRAVGTPEIDEAAEFLAARFSQLGLRTDLFDGSPFQEFLIPADPEAGAPENNALALQRAGEEPLRAALDEGMRPLALGRSGRAAGPVVFAGYGIAAPDLGYDDFAGIDLSGKVVMILRRAPRYGQEDAPLTRGSAARNAYFSTKVAAAVERGAAAVVILNDAQSVAEQQERVRERGRQEAERIEKLQQQLEQLPPEARNVRERLTQGLRRAEDQQRQLERDAQVAGEGLLEVGEAGGIPGRPEAVPVVSLGRSYADHLLQSVLGQSLGEIEEAIAADLRPRSAELTGWTAEVAAEVQATQWPARNVVAELPGAGALADQTIVVGAHYDHVGMGGYGSLAPGTIAVHNGADDNGSGTVAMLEIARRLAEQVAEGGLAERRRIVFIAFSAEERGLLGSAHYVRNPRFSLEETAAMVNLDMIGRLHDDQLTVGGTGTSPGFDALLDQANSRAGFSLTKEPSGDGPSDHQSFSRREIPVLFFFTGFHPDYHRPSDEFERINLNGLARITDMVTEVVERLASDPERPAYVATSRRASRGGADGGAFLGVQLAAAASGVRLSAVVADSPAAAAGLRVGDVIVRIDDEAVALPEAVPALVGARQPGDAIEIQWLRDGQTMRSRVVLGRRGGR